MVRSGVVPRSAWLKHAASGIHRAVSISPSHQSGLVELQYVRSNQGVRRGSYIFYYTMTMFVRQGYHADPVELQMGSKGAR
jgi:hypothetical protein